MTFVAREVRVYCIALAKKTLYGVALAPESTLAVES